MPFVQVRDQAGVSGHSAQQVSRDRGRRWIVQLRERAEEAEVTARLLGAEASDRDAEVAADGQAAADGGGDLPERDAFVGGCVQAYTSSAQG